MLNIVWYEATLILTIRQPCFFQLALVFVANYSNYSNKIVNLKKKKATNAVNFCRLIISNRGLLEL